MKVRLNYTPWKLTLQPAYWQTTAGKDDPTPIRSGPGGESVVSEIYHGIKSWRRFPVAIGEGQASDSVFVLLDRIQTPLALLDPKYSTIAKAEKIRPSELPKPLRDLYQHLVALGHAQPDVATDTEPEGKRA